MMMNAKAGLPQIRRLEAVSFRSFPASQAQYDGTWVIRLTQGHPAKRLNSVNPLDPQDNGSINQRVEQAQKIFDDFNRPLVFRQSPLAPIELEANLNSRGWEVFDESLIMIVDMTNMDLSEFEDRLPIKNVANWVQSFLELSSEPLASKDGLVGVISSIEPVSGLFVKNSGKQEVAAIRCVCEGDLLGLFDLVTGHAYQGKGYARCILGSAMKWGKLSGARYAWLQVVTENKRAIKLYKDFGFEEYYRYKYHRAPSLS